MKGKKLVLMLVAIIVALSAAVMVACPDEPERVPGPETGTYYYEVGGKELYVNAHGRRSVCGSKRRRRDKDRNVRT